MRNFTSKFESCYAKKTLFNSLFNLMLKCIFCNLLEYQDFNKGWREICESAHIFSAYQFGLA